MLKLNLGCSDDLKSGYLNVDVLPADRIPGATADNYLQVDLTGQVYIRQAIEDGEDDGVKQYKPGPVMLAYEPKPWPWEDSSVDVIFAHDVFEHIDNQKYPRDKGIIWVLNEAHRILKPNGALDLWVPSRPGSAPWVDPTHVSVWSADTRYYVDERWNNQRGERGRLGEAYGITAVFRTLSLGESGVDWKPIQYAKDAPDRHKIKVLLQAVK